MSRAGRSRMRANGSINALTWIVWDRSARKDSLIRGERLGLPQFTRHGHAKSCNFVAARFTFCVYAAVPLSRMRQKLMSNNFNFAVVPPLETSDSPAIKPLTPERLISIKYAAPNGSEVTRWLRESEVPGFLAGTLYHCVAH